MRPGDMHSTKSIVEEVLQTARTVLHIHIHTHMYGSFISIRKVPFPSKEYPVLLSRLVEEAN